MVILLALAVAVLLSSCSSGSTTPGASGSASSKPSSSSSPGTAYLAAVQGLDLREGHPANVQFRVTDEAVDILVVVTQPLALYSLQALSAPPGAQHTVGAPIPLGGNGSSNGGLTAYLLPSPTLEAGWYRFQFEGRGQLRWLAIVER